MDFFPPNSLDSNPELDEFSRRWYERHLMVMEEQPLYPPASRALDVYRLLFLPTFEQPTLVRLSRSHGRWSAVCKQTDGQGGFDEGQLISDSQRELSISEAKKVVELLDRMDFWTMPSFLDDGGLDGEQAILEGVSGGRYHVVDRWCPEGTEYATLVRFLLTLRHRQE